MTKVDPSPTKPRAGSRARLYFHKLLTLLLPGCIALHIGALLGYWIPGHQCLTKGYPRPAPPLHFSVFCNEAAGVHGAHAGPTMRKPMPA